jgi:hypothetical protein
VSALRLEDVNLQQPELQETTEVIYLVVPTAAPTHSAKPLNLIEQFAVLGMNFRQFAHRYSNSTHAMFGTVAILAVVGYSLYTIKSAMGIDLLPNSHIENIFGIPGFGRW